MTTEAKLIKILVLVVSFINSIKCRVNKASSKYNCFFLFDTKEGRPRLILVHNFAIDRWSHMKAYSSKHPQQFSPHNYEQAPHSFVVTPELQWIPCTSIMSNNPFYEYKESRSPVFQETWHNNDFREITLELSKYKELPEIKTGCGLGHYLFSTAHRISG